MALRGSTPTSFTRISLASTQVICDDTIFLVGPSCENRFETHERLIELFKTIDDRGHCFRAKASIPKGILLFESLGGVFLIEEAKKRQRSSYTMRVDGDTYVDKLAALSIITARRLIRV